MKTEEDDNVGNEVHSPEFILQNIRGFWYNPVTENVWHIYSIEGFGKPSSLTIRQKNAVLKIHFSYTLTCANNVVSLIIDGVSHQIISFARMHFTFKITETETITLQKHFSV
jgi:hypothetical protein